jgi:hypothetical protein
MEQNIYVQINNDFQEVQFLKNHFVFLNKILFIKNALVVIFQE